MSITVEHVSKHYGPIIALRDVGFTVAPGEVRALFGGNGSGKSTLAKIVSGAVRPDSGRVSVDGAPIPAGSPRAAHAAGITTTFQELSLLPDLTVAENLALTHVPRVAGLFRADKVIRAEARAVLGRLGLAHLENLPVQALQVGEKYLVELAKALRLEPRYLILDELTSALHEHEAQLVKRVLAEHCKAGGGAILVSHRLGEIQSLCDTITVLRNGEVVADTDVASVSSDDLIRWVGGGSRTGDRGGARARTTATKTARRVELSNVALEADAGEVSLTVGKGEILGLGGLPDQGQAAILACLFGLREVRAPARLLLDGAPVQLRSPTDAVRAGIAYVSGDRDEVGFAIRSLQENMLALLLNRRDPIRLDEAQLEQALSELSTVHGGLTNPLNSLSGGNQQKVLLARCFLLRPKLLLAADPTKGIDVAARAEVHQAIRRLAAEQGTAVVLTSSDDRELAALCDRVLVLEKRMIIRELHAGAGLDEQALVESYLQAPAADRHQAAGAGSRP